MRKAALSMLCWGIGWMAIAATVADDRIEVLQLRQRPAEQVIPVIRPLLRADEAVTGSGFKLILRARPQTIAEVRKVLERIDAGLKNLLVLVTDEDMRSRSHGSAGVGIRYHSERGGGISVRAAQDQYSEDVNIVQRIRVVEGMPARLHTGTAIINTHSYGTSHYDVGSGVNVIPRVNGEMVNLEIEPYRGRLQMGTRQGGRLTRQQADVQQLSTVVSGRLGDWIFLGGVSQSANSGSRRIFSGSQQSSTENSGVWVKVLLAD